MNINEQISELNLNLKYNLPFVHKFIYFLIPEKKETNTTTNTSFLFTLKLKKNNKKS